jgi:hypothetical protein
MSTAPDDEVDFGRYGAAIAARWWLPLGGLLLGALVGALLASGAKQVNRASVTIFLGQPLSATGSNPIQTLGTNPSTVRAVIRSQAAVDRAASAAGVAASEFRAGITSAPVAGFLAKAGQTPLVAVSVTADVEPAKLRQIATSLAESAIESVSPFVDTKIEGYRKKVEQDTRELARLDARLNAVEAEIKGKALSTAEKLVLLNLQTLSEQRRTNVLADQIQSQQLLAQAETVERGKIVAPASSGKTTARSKRNSIVVGGLMGLVLGTIAALFWSRRRPS